MSTAIIVDGEAVDPGTGEVRNLPVPAASGRAPVSHAVARGAVGLLKPIAPASDVLEAQNEVRAYVHSVLKEGRDYGKIPGVDKPSMLKPGAERVTLAFGLTPEFTIEEQTVDHVGEYPWVKRKWEWHPTIRGQKVWSEEKGVSYGLYRYVVRCDLRHRETGVVVASCIGVCSTLESKYVDRPRDVENTVLKMAQKRAFVGATLIATGLSDEFTQDVEDLPREHFGAAASASSPASGAEPAPAAPAPNVKCPKCGGAAMYDNRAENDARAERGEKLRPDFKCRTRGCDGVIWRDEKKEGSKEAPKDAKAAPVRDLSWAAAMPFPFQKGKPVHGTPMGEMSTESLQKVAAWIREKQAETPDFHEPTLAAITIILEDRAKMQTDAFDQADEEPSDEAIAEAENVSAGERAAAWAAKDARAAARRRTSADDGSFVALGQRARQLLKDPILSDVYVATTKKLVLAAKGAETMQKVVDDIEGEIERQRAKARADADELAEEYDGTDDLPF